MTKEQARELWDDSSEAPNPSGTTENGAIDLYDIEGMNEAAHALYEAMLKHLGEQQP